MTDNTKVADNAVQSVGKEPKKANPKSKATKKAPTKSSGKTASAAGGTSTSDQLSAEEVVDRGYTLFDEFINAYQSEWSRLDECEQLYRADHWDNMDKDDDDPTPTTPVLHSTVENIAADIMSRYPEALVLPESPEDEQVARVVGALIKQNHDASHYIREYRNIVHDLLVSGYAAQEIGYDVSANRGIGGAFIRYVDCHNVLFDPQVENLQDGRAVFKFQAKTVDWLEKRYPQYKGEFAKDSYEMVEDSVVKFDQSKSIFMIEYWWREFVPDDSDNKTGQWRVHMAKMAGRKMLEDSREEKPDGYFASGEYPFNVTPLYRRKGSCLGWGLCDMYGGQQKYGDRLDQIVLKNASLASHNKLLVTGASGFDVEDLADWSKEVHIGNSLNGVTWFATPPLPQYTVAYAGQIREGIKEESGANDVSRGNIGSGVTSASAIAALQEMSNKRSRIISDLLHDAFKWCVRYEIEVEREFSLLPRQVMYTDQSGQQISATFESAIMSRQTELGNNVPIEFYVSIKIQQENRYTIQAHNDLILQMVDRQMINPQKAVELMEFEGKETMLSSMRQEQQQMAGQISTEEMAMQEQAAQQAQLEQQMAGMPQPEQVVA